MKMGKYFLKTYKKENDPRTCTSFMYFVSFIYFVSYDVTISWKKKGRSANFVNFQKQSFALQNRLMFFKTGFPKNFVLFTGKHPCWSLFNKVAGLQGCNFIKKRFQHRYFPVNIMKFLWTNFFHRTSLL